MAFLVSPPITYFIFRFFDKTQKDTDFLTERMQTFPEFEDCCLLDVTPCSLVFTIVSNGYASFYPEDGGRKFIRNVDEHLPDYPRRL
jgi:hypothetical protein